MKHIFQTKTQHTREVEAVHCPPILNDSPSGYGMGENLAATLPKWADHCSETIAQKGLDEFNAAFFDPRVDALEDMDDVRLGYDRAIHKLATVPLFNTERLRTLWDTSKAYSFLKEKYEDACGFQLKAKQAVEDVESRVGQLKKETRKTGLVHNFWFMVAFLIITTLGDAASQFSFFQNILTDYAGMVYLTTGMIALLSNPPSAIFVSLFQKNERGKKDNLVMWLCLATMVSVSLFVFVIRIAGASSYFHPVGIESNGATEAALSTGQWMTAALLGVIPLATMVFNIATGLTMDQKTYELVKEKREQRKLEKEFNLSVAKTDEYRCKKDEMEVVMATVAHDIETRDFEELDETLYEKTLQLNASVADFLKKEAREEFSYDADSATQVMQRFHIA